ncbi:MAG: hypothetical protein J5789_05605 [Oscillospiraceae bacterium]|nr:hypothetical protein [Oscillospiraceae bacterium]
MKKRVLVLGLILILAIVLVGCADKKPASPQETAPQENDSQVSEVQSVTLCVFKEPVIIQQTEFKIEKNIFFNREHSASIDEIDRINSIVKNVSNWSADAVGTEDLLVDGYFGLSDEEYPFYYSYNNNILFYETFSLDNDAGKVVEVVRHYATISETDMEYIKSLRDSKDGFIG